MRDLERRGSLRLCPEGSTVTVISTSWKARSSYSVTEGGLLLSALSLSRHFPLCHHSSSPSALSPYKDFPSQ